VSSLDLSRWFSPISGHFCLGLLTLPKPSTKILFKRQFRKLQQNIRIVVLKKKKEKQKQKNKDKTKQQDV